MVRFVERWLKPGSQAWRCEAAECRDLADRQFYKECGKKSGVVLGKGSEQSRVDLAGNRRPDLNFREPLVVQV
jgi:hypothetical protein